MIEGMKVTIKISLREHMDGEFDLILFSRKFDKEEIIHLTIEMGVIHIKRFSTIAEFTKDQWIEEGDLEDYIDFADDDDQIFRLIKAKYPDVQRVAFMNH